MFHYQPFRVNENGLLAAFAAAYPLATVVSNTQGNWHSSHIPLFLEAGGTQLFGHADIANPQFASDIASACIVFPGPNAYIPPLAYCTPQLPTWNYVALHVTGRVMVSDDPALRLETLRKTAERLSDSPDAFKVDPENIRVQRWIAGIRCVRVDIESIEGRFKLSQDKAFDDRMAALRHFCNQQPLQPNGLLARLAGLTRDELDFNVNRDF